MFYIFLILKAGKSAKSDNKGKFLISRINVLTACNSSICNRPEAALGYYSCNSGFFEKNRECLM